MVRDNFKAKEVAKEHSKAEVMFRDNFKAEEMMKDYSKVES